MQKQRGSDSDVAAHEREIERKRVRHECGYVFMCIDRERGRERERACKRELHPAVAAAATFSHTDTKFSFIQLS